MDTPRKPESLLKPPKIALPRTDAEALSDIVSWSSNRPPWQRQALHQLTQNETLSSEQYEELYSLSKSGKDPSLPLVNGD